MWPTALQLTRDECRGILRRLELESYANVISVFRAQGGLTDTKSKLLEDLRNVFHISQERHRAEARRVANDEQLSTIAEAISGPNTYQEWSREGRRPYPLLPRVPPQTALCVVANHVAAEVTNENTQLPFPSETGTLQQPKQEFTERTSETSIPVVTSDPFKPEIPDIRKTLKRNLPTETTAASSTKKRIISEASPSATTTGEPPLSPATQIRKLYHNHSKTQSKQKNTPAKKTNNSPMKRPTAGSAKKRLISGESVDSNKANNVNTTPGVLQSTHQLSSAPSTVTNVDLVPPPPLPSSTVTSSQSIISQDISVESQSSATTSTAASTATTTSIPTTIIPQIATSKKDISKNLSKLNLTTTSQPVLQQSDKITECKTDKLSTPVQKYIVDNRIPMTSTQFLDKQQVITNKLKPMTAIVPTPLSASSKPKITNVKTLKSGMMCSTPVSSQPQVFNIIDPSSPPYIPHTPPAIINISSKFEPEHGKVLKTKLLPLMLSSGSKLEPSSSSSSPGQMKTSPLSTPGTVFRKPNIIKSSVPPTKPKIHITNQQIISPPTVASLKMSPHLHLKGVPGGGPIHNRNSVKIFSSSNGKMFIQAADSSGKQISKLNTIVPAQKGLVNTTNTPPGRIAIQKVHIIPAPGSMASTSSGTSLSNVTIPKSMAISKPNMIIMPMSGQQTMKGLPIVKSNKFSTLVPSQMTVQAETSTNNPKSNVIVIGSVPSMPQTILPKEIHGFSSRNSMITEDTPVDIITTPLIVDVDSIDSQALKPTETIDLTMGDSNLNSAAQSNKTTASLTMVSKRLTSESSYSDVSEKTEGEVNVVQQHKQQQQPQQQQPQQQQQQQQQQPQPQPQQQQDSMVIGVTDWEMELDQEANKTRALNAEKIRTRNSVENMVIGSGAEDNGSSDEHFAEDDVIEEHEETEEEMEIAANLEREQRDSKREKEMQEKKRQEQLQLATHRHHQQYEEDEEETIEVGDEQMKTSSEGDVIQYDESYESANDELDENITIEYVEDEPDGYDEKIDSTSNDQKDTTESNINVIQKPSSANQLQSDPTLESSEHKSHSSTNDDSMVSVEEISSTTQQNISQLNSKNEH